MNPNNSNIVYIMGNPASGKSVIGYLLDGHPHTAVTHFHDLLYKIFDDSKSVEQIIKSPDNVKNNKYVDILNFRKRLPNSYYKMQRITEGTEIEHPSSRDDPQDIDRSFDFYKFEEELFDDLLNKDVEDAETIIKYILHHFFKYNEEIGYNEEENEYFVGRGGTNSKMWRYILENFSNAKIIYVSRDPRDILASRKEYNFDDLIKSGHIFDYVSTDKEAMQFKNLYEDFEVYEFEDIILNTEQTMNDMCKFLNISKKDILYNPSYGGKLLKTESPIIGEINDRYTDVLDDKQRKMVDLQYLNDDKSKVELEGINQVYTFLLSWVDWKLKRTVSPFIKDFGRKVLP